MLLELRVGNLALVDDLVLRFEAGLTILTGETGAGKSLIAGALSLLTGGKADREAIRQGEEMAHVEGVFDLADRPDLDPVVHTLGVRLAEDRILVLRREMRREGRGRVLINGMVSSLALLEQIGPLLLSVQSQDQQRLLGQSTFAGDFLDGALKLQASRDLVAGNLQRFNALAEKLAARTREEEFARQQLEMWEYQLQELEEAGLDPEEESALTEKIALGRNSRALLEGAGKALETLADGEISARQLLNAAAAALEPAARSSSRLEAVLEMIREAETAAAEAGSDLERFLDSVDVDPARLDELEERQSLYASLQRKYNRDVGALVELQDDLRDRVGRQRNAASELEALAAELEKARAQLADQAEQLRRARLTGSGKVAARARDLIRPLALADLELAFEITPRLDEKGQVDLDGRRCRVTPAGADRISLLVRPNRGEPFGEVGKIASGGEKSRIFLGLSVLAGADEPQPLLLFDEIDAGLGMDNAVPVARLLARLAEGGQVLCITHLPTVAAMGRQHLKVAKSVAAGRTTVQVQVLSAEDRVGEVARLLGGEMSGAQAVESQVDYARQLLAAAGAS
jgi:DNA repair protein RecN (Recombination protein N)